MSTAVIVPGALAIFGLAGLCHARKALGNTRALQEYGMKVEATVTGLSEDKYITILMYEFKDENSMKYIKSYPGKFTFDSLKEGDGIEIIYEKGNPDNNLPPGVVEKSLKFYKLFFNIMLLELFVVTPVVYFILR